MKSLSALIILFAFLGLTSAQDATTKDSEDETKCCCTTYDTSVCLTKVLTRVGEQLNDRYQRALKVAKRYTPQDEQNLKAAQRAWIAYRDAACKAEYGLDGGSGGPNAHAMCIVRLTKQRSTELQDAYLQER